MTAGTAGRWCPGSAGMVNIAITGATGFLGLHLVRELLRDERNALVLLAHAGSGDAMSRVTAFLELIGMPSSAIAEARGRMRVIPVDVRVPRLGLAEPDFQRLAGQLDAVWHSAGNVRLNDDLAVLRRVNVDGARHILDLVAAGAGRPVLFHVSTAFVAGSRTQGTVYEDELDHGAAFENPYEQSKYEAEVLVREWSARHGRPVVVLRPGILVTSRPPHPDLPAHPLEFVSRSFAPARRLLGLAGPRARHELPEVRLAGRRDGHLNFMPVEAAAEVMVALSRQRPSGGVDTYHVVHGREVPVPVVVEVLQQLAPVRLKPCRIRRPIRRCWNTTPGCTAASRRFCGTSAGLTTPARARCSGNLARKSTSAWNTCCQGSICRAQTAAGPAPPAPPASGQQTGRSPIRPSPLPRRRPCGR